MVWWLWAQSLYPLSTLDSDVSTHKDQQIAKEQLSTLAEYGLQGCCIWNAQEGFHHFSDNWSSVTGLPPADCFGMQWMDYFHPDASEEFHAAIKDLFSDDPYDRTDSFRLEAQIMRGDSTWGWLHMTLIYMPGMGGSARHNVSILINDITTQKQSMQEAADAQRESQIAQHGRSTFLSNMSHELRTPLNAVLGFAQMLEAGLAAGEQNALEYLRHIRESGENLLVKINDLIEIANMDAHRCHMTEEPLNLHEVIQAAIERHSHAAFERDIKIKLELDRPYIVIQADRPKLTHVVGNILSNAIEHSIKEGQIVIRAFASAQDGIYIIVSDNGTGIPKDHLEKVADLKEKTDDSDPSADIGNIGIALAIARELVELHHGKLSIKTIPGQGTIATIHLPAGRIISLSARVKSKRLSRLMA